VHSHIRIADAVSGTSRNQLVLPAVTLAKVAGKVRRPLTVSKLLVTLTIALTVTADFSY